MIHFVLFGGSFLLAVLSVSVPQTEEGVSLLIFELLGLVSLILMVWIGLAIKSQRLHDVGMSAW